MPEMPDHEFLDMTEPELKALFRRLSEIIDIELPAGTGFVLLAAPFGTHGVAQYVSNVQRDDAARWMVETIHRWANGDEVPR